MITAIVFIEADVTAMPQTAQDIAALDGVSAVYSVTGQLDLIALIKVPDIDGVSTVVTEHVNKVRGVLKTETHIAFRTFSKDDLESAFSIGLD